MIGRRFDILSFVSRGAIEGAPSTTVVFRAHPARRTALLFVVLAVAHVCVVEMSILKNMASPGWMMPCAAGLFLVAVVCWVVHVEYRLMHTRRCIRVSVGIGRLFVHRSIPFDQIRGVRVNAIGRGCRVEDVTPSVDLLCDNEELRLPYTRYPRQQALAIANATRVPVIDHRLARDESDAGSTRGPSEHTNRVRRYM
jgi:hypothetical protein